MIKKRIMIIFSNHLFKFNLYNAYTLILLLIEYISGVLKNRINKANVNWFLLIEWNINSGREINFKFKVNVLDRIIQIL